MGIQAGKESEGILVRVWNMVSLSHEDIRLI